VSGPTATAAADPTEDRPLLAVAHGYRSVPLFQLAEAARPHCDLLFLVDGGDPEVISSRPLLDRLGRVIDVGSLGPDAMAEVVAPWHPDGIIAFRDLDLVPLSELALRLNLDFHTPVVALRLVDKVEQRLALAAGGLAMPAVTVLGALGGSDSGSGSGETDLGDVTFPAVLKPRQGSGSWHTYYVRDRDHLESVLGSLRALDGGSEELILEEYLDGSLELHDDGFADYVSVETLFAGGQPHHLAITGRFHPAPPFRETGFFIPSHLSQDRSDAVVQLAGDALDALGVRWGCTHTEIKFTPDGPRVIEINGRMGGGISDILKLSSGADLLQWCLLAAVNGDLGTLDPPTHTRIGYRFFYQPPAWAERVRHVDGVDQVSKIKGVDDVTFHHHPGDPINASEGSRSLLFSVVGTAEDHGGVRRSFEQMHAAVNVSYEGDTARRADAMAPPPLEPALSVPTETDAPAPA
jgi:biotin carboxylase